MRRKLVVHPNILIDLLRVGEHHYKVIRDGLPNNIKVIEGNYDLKSGMIELVVECAEWHPTAAWQVNPVFVPVPIMKETKEITKEESKNAKKRLQLPVGKRRRKNKRGKN